MIKPISIKAADIIAGIIVVGFFGAKAYGFDGYVDAAFMLIVGYYFGHKISQKNGQT
jgi:hypothetical protein